MSTELKKKLVYAMLEFLNQSISDGTVRSDDKESMEVAMQCISESFDVEWDPESPGPLSMKPGNLLSVFEVFVKTQKKVSSPAPASSSTQPQAESSGAAPSAEAKASADALKSEGNVLLAKKDYSGAVEKYTEAIALDSTNPIYYSNRAAAHSQLGANDQAIEDALKALDVDPSFAKAYSRLGHGYFSSCQYEKAVEAYEKGLELEPDNSVIRKSLATAKSKLDSSSPTSRGTDFANPTPAGAPSGIPGMGGAGGMPDLSALMNNPMMASMAQNLMANGGLERMMQNPMIQQMMNSMGGAGGGGGGMPDLSALMNNPAAREMAANLMGGQAGNPANPNNSSNDNMYS